MISKVMDTKIQVEQINTFLNDIPGKIVTFLIVNKDFEFSIYEIKNYVINGVVDKEPQTFSRFITSIDGLVKQGILVKNAKNNKYSINPSDPVIIACINLNVALRSKIKGVIYDMETQPVNIELDLEAKEAINRFIHQKKTCLDDNRAFIVMSLLYGMHREYITDKNIDDVLKELKSHQVPVDVGGGNSWMQKMIKDGYIKMVFNFDLDKTVYAATPEGRDFFEKYKLAECLRLGA